MAIGFSDPGPGTPMRSDALEHVLFPQTYCVCLCVHVTWGDDYGQIRVCA